MGTLLHDALRERGRRGTGLVRPVNDALGRPREVAPVRVGHVHRECGVAKTRETARVRGHSLALGEHFDGLRTQADLHLLAGQSVGHGVVMAIAANLDVVVDGDLRLLPRGEVVGVRGQGFERGAIDLFEDASP